MSYSASAFSSSKMNNIIEPSQLQPSDLENRSDLVIGEGASAIVYKAKWNGMKVAVKKFDSSCPSRMSQDFNKEIMLLSKIDHKNIVKLLGFCAQRNNTYLVSELMEGGSLFDHIRDKNNQKFNWNVNLKLIKDIVTGMVYLHSNSILHLDLKSLNILLNKESNIAKISDFGLSQINSITSTLSRAPTSRVAKGTTRYMPCEIAKGIKPSYKSDVWSFGCILLEFVTRELPFSSLTDQAIFVMLQTDAAEIPLNFNTETPQVIADLISKCLVRNPVERPSFETIEKAFKSIDDENIKVTLKSHQIKIKSISQNSQITNTQTLKSILHSIKTNYNTNSEKQIETLQKQINDLNLQVASQQQQGRQYLDQAVGYGRQECTPCMAYSSPKYDDFSSKFDDIDVREILYSLNSSNNQRPSSSQYTSTGSSIISRGSANGRMLETGPRGGLFYINGNGNRTYVPRDTPNQHSGFSTGSTNVSSGAANGRTVYQGPRGGNYTINPSGNKTYLPKSK